MLSNKGISNLAPQFSILFMILSILRLSREKLISTQKVIMENTDVNFVEMKGKQEKWNERAPTHLWILILS